ncbi:MAG: DNA polymerase IV [Acidimicrobiales bacterium]
MTIGATSGPAAPEPSGPPNTESISVDPAILHVDMDAFFASVEVLLDPSLRGRPVIVGGAGPRGVVAACTYEARAYGVHSAMAGVKARRLCPQAIFLPGRYERYAEFSVRLHEVLAHFSPLVEGISIDEAFVDVSGARRLLGTGEHIGWKIRDAIASELGLPASVGVATTKFVAKLASEAAKPHADHAGTRPGLGVCVVPAGGELAFLHPLPVRALWGVGPATHKRLSRFGVETVGDLAAVPLESLRAALGPSLGAHLHELAWARDPRRVEPVRAVKSVSHEETYATDIRDPALLATEALRLGDSVAGRLRRAGLAGRTVTLKVRYHDFATITRSHTLPEPVDTGPAVSRTAMALLAGVDPSSGVRLIGVGVSNLSEGAARQLSLLGPGPEETPSSGEGSAEDWERATAAIDLIRGRFGESAVGPAALLGVKGLRVKRRGDTQWGPAADA